MEYEQTTDTSYDVTMAVELGCNDVLEDVSPKKGSTPHHKIKKALDRLKDEYSFGIPDKETLNDSE